MDLSGSGDVAVRHIVRLEPLNIVHDIRLSESFVPLAKEIRKCVFAIAGAWALVKLAHIVTDSRNDRKIQ